MPCYHPLTLKADPKRIGKSHTVPCGRCIGCKIEHGRQWAVRGTHELQFHEHSSFVTLTKRDVTVPNKDQDASCPHSVWTNAKSPPNLTTTSNIAPDAIATHGEDRSEGAVDSFGGRTNLVPYQVGTRAPPSLVVPDGTGPSISMNEHQLFMKRLLKRLRAYGPIRPLRFMMCGEYGEKNGRPHYHYILFGYEFPDRKRFKRKNGYQLYRSSLLEQVWPYGQADIAAATFDSINYVAGYVTKKLTGEWTKPRTNCWCGKKCTSAKEHYGDLTPEFFRMSRRPGIGRQWIDKYRSSVYPNDRVVINGTQAKPPRYYDERLKALDPNAHERVKKGRDERPKDLEARAPKRLRAGETILRARMNQRKRSME